MVVGGFEGSSVSGFFAWVSYSFQLFADAFCVFELRGVPASLFGESLTSVGFDGDDLVGTVRDPGYEVLEGLIEVGCRVGVGSVEGFCPLAF